MRRATRTYGVNYSTVESSNRRKKQIGERDWQKKEQHDGKQNDEHRGRQKEKKQHDGEQKKQKGKHEWVARRALYGALIFQTTISEITTALLQHAQFATTIMYWERRRVSSIADTYTTRIASGRGSTSITIVPSAVVVLRRGITL